jgi:hypothetical protein
MATNFRMVNSVNNAIKIINLSIITIYVSFTPLISIASTIGAWTATDAIYEAGAIVINATKTAIIDGTSTVLTSTARYIPTALEVGGLALRYGAYGAIAYAVTSLIGSGIQYLIDGSGVHYTPNANPSNYQYAYSGSVANAGSCSGYTTSQLSNCVQTSYRNFYNDSRVTASCAGSMGDFKWVCSVIVPDVGTIKPEFGRQTNPLYNPAIPTPTPQTVDLPTLGQKILDNAFAGHQASQDLLKQSINDSLSNTNNPPLAGVQGGVKSQLDKNVKYPSETTASATSTNHVNASGVVVGASAKVEIPEFCKFATKLCSWLEWVQDDELPQQNNTSLPTITPDLNTLDTSRVNFNGSCPAPIALNFSLMGRSNNVKFDYAPLCDVLATYRWVIIAMGYISGAYIIMGINRNGSE